MTVAVIGAGPAGITAAALLADSGVPVSLIDENEAPGGCLTYDRSVPGSDALLAELQLAVTRPGIDWAPGTVAWAAFRRGNTIELALTDGVRERSLIVERIVIAAGTTDRAWTGPGATLPGVMTARALRILVDRHDVIPAGRFAVIGGGMNSMPIAALLESCGCDVAGVFAADLVASIEGASGVNEIALADGRRFAVDAVVIACGESPDSQLAGMLELPRLYDPEVGGWRVAAIDSGDGVYSIGGALIGAATIADVVESAVEAVERIAGQGADLATAGLPEVNSIRAEKGHQR